MDDTTKRQISWILIVTFGLALIVYAGQQRSLVPRALERLSRGTLAEQVEAARILVARGKVGEALKDQPRWVQTAAVKALLELGTPEAIQQLTEAVPLFDEPVGNWATAATVSFGRMAIGPLVECMQSKDGGVRTAAQGPLTKIGLTPEGGPAVIAALSPFMGAYDDFVRAGVVAVLAPLGKPAAPVAIKTLLQKMPGPDQTSAAFARAQDTAIELLVAMKEPALEPIITQLVPHEREKLRATAALMLGRMAGALGDKAGEIVPPLLRLIGDGAWSVRRRAAWALGELREKGRQPEILAALTLRLQDEPEVKAAAVKSLGQIGSPASAAPLVQTLLTNREGAVQELVVALTSLGAPALPALQMALQSPDAEAREAATEAVAGIGTAAAVPLLAGRLSDASVSVRRIAAQALALQANASAVDALSRALSDSDPVVYGAVRRAFVRLGEEAVPPLIARLGSGDPRVALVASEALNAIGPRAVPALAAALRSDNGFTRDWAAVTLGNLGRPALPAVSAVLADGAAPVSSRAAAARALGRSRLPEAVPPLAEAASAAFPELRQEVLRALAATRQPEATTPLVAGLSDPVVAVRLTALRLVKDWQVGDADKQLTALLGSGDEQTKRMAAVALAFHASPGITPLLGPLFGTPAAAAEGQTEIAPLLNAAVEDPGELPEVRRLALIGLAYRGNQQSVDVLVKFLTPDNPLAGLAARALGLLGGRMAEQEGPGSVLAAAARDRLLEILEKTDSQALRLQTATGLSLVGGSAAPALLERLNTAPEAVQPWLAAALGAMGKPANDEAMRERGRERQSKEWASVAIMLIGNPESIKFLARLPQSEQPSAEKLAQARALYDQIMKVRAAPLA